jgi:hypothetical protein
MEHGVLYIHGLKVWVLYSLTNSELIDDEDVDIGCTVDVVCIMSEKHLAIQRKWFVMVQFAQLSRMEHGVLHPLKVCLLYSLTNSTSKHPNYIQLSLVNHCGMIPSSLGHL